MGFFQEFLCLLITLSLYWVNSKRRKILHRRLAPRLAKARGHQRIGKEAIKNVYQFGRNLNFMLSRGELKLNGNLALLKKNCILYSFHFGIWELMPKTLNKMGYKVGIVVNRYQDKKRNLLTLMADKFLFNYRHQDGVEVFYKEDTMKIIRFIKNSGSLGILVDGNTFYAKFEKVKRLGHICGVPVIPFAAYREHNQGILKIDCDLAMIVKKRPLDYMWFYKSRES